jgi:DNA-binding transcriptional LysR family regulator
MFLDAEIRQLRALQAIAKEGSFGRAAERLGFTQSAISQQIAALERAVGDRIFDRPGGPRRVVLTPIGEVALAHADRVLAACADADDSLRALRAGETGRLMIGSIQSVSVRALPGVIGRLLSERPNVNVRCFDLDEREDLEHGLIDDTFDLAFIPNADPHPDLDMTVLLDDPYVFISPRGRFGNTVPVDELRRTQLIGEPDGQCQRRVDERLRLHGVEPDYVYRSGDYAAVQAMVRTGMGGAVMPLLGVDFNDREVQVSALEPMLQPRQIVIAKRRGRTLPNVAERFIELAQDVFSSLPTLDEALARAGATDALV